MIAVIAWTLTSLGAPLAAQNTAGWRLEPALEAQRSNTDKLLIGISIVNESVVWVSGAGGTWARTTDGGATWRSGVVAGADSLQFRDVHATSATTAYLLSIGEGAQSRIYKTTDGGASWSLQFTNREPRGFFDCFGFWDADSGIAISDSFDGHFLMIATTNGGATWTPIPVDRLPPANEGEGAFASSGTCLVALGDGTAWIGTGAGGNGSRILRTTDRGQTWTVVQTPIIKGAAAGITTLAFRDARNGAALGGDIGQPDSVTDNVALTRDAGSTWTLRTRPSFTGAAYGSSWVPGAPSPTLVAVGPKGLSYTIDEARTWVALDTLNHWGVSFAAPDRGWAVGPNGRITRVRLYSIQGR
jgi:photosystem II stability/assembly factor-like uncharacterized protein